MTAPAHEFRPQLDRRRHIGRLFALACLLMTLVGALVLAVLIANVVYTGGRWVSMDFLRRFPSMLTPERSGIKSALWGSIWLISLTSLFAIPVGMAAALYLHEYAPRNRLTRIIELNIANLAGIPSVVYGILGLAVFARGLHLGRSVLAGALTLALLVLPVIIIASREAIAAVPDSFRQAAFGVGATRWQMIRSHVLPNALPGMMTGVILALSRALGEAAPLMVLGALTFVTFVPQGPRDEFTALPLQVYNWAEQPLPVFHEIAAAGIIVLLGMLLSMNAVAVGIRGWHQRKKVW